MYGVPFVNREAIQRNMVLSRGLPQIEMTRLLDCLSHKELAILRRHDDLIGRVAEISKMRSEELCEVLQKDFSLEIQEWSVESCVWVDVTKLGGNLPKWMDIEHVGWHFSSVTDAEFLWWAKKFLLQEVRINIWSRYIEHKRQLAKSIESLSYAHAGLYL